MTPKEKAIELCRRISKTYWRLPDSSTKKIALIFIDEILNDYKIFNENKKSYKVPSFWELVRQEVENQPTD